MRKLITVAAGAAAVLALAACDQLRQVRDATIGTAGRIYVDQVCAAGPVAEPIRDQQRAEIYVETGGLYAEADCAYRPGDTVDDYLARRAAAAESAGDVLDQAGEEGAGEGGATAGPLPDS
jgi:hypothetical protein